MGHIVVGRVLLMSFLIPQLRAGAHQGRLSRALCLRSTCETQYSEAHSRLRVGHYSTVFPPPLRAFGG
eukprot:2552906-Pyramimonas_sp.AAC.1